MLNKKQRIIQLIALDLSVNEERAYKVLTKNRLNLWWWII